MIKIFGFNIVLFIKSNQDRNMCSERIKESDKDNNNIAKNFNDLAKIKFLHEKLPDIEIDESITDSNTCLIDMSILDEEEEDALTMEINFKEIEKKLQLKRKITIAIITLIFTISIGFITYSVMSDLKTQRGKI